LDVSFAEAQYLASVRFKFLQVSAIAILCGTFGIELTFQNFFLLKLSTCSIGPDENSEESVL